VQPCDCATPATSQLWAARCRELGCCKATEGQAERCSNAADADDSSGSSSSSDGACCVVRRHAVRSLSRRHGEAAATLSQLLHVMLSAARGISKKFQQQQQAVTAAATACCACLTGQHVVRSAQLPPGRHHTEPLSQHNALLDRVVCGECRPVGSGALRTTCWPVKARAAHQEPASAQW
jgi:hypothetical protein